MLHTSAFGLGSVAASWLLKRDGLLAAEADEPGGTAQARTSDRRKGGAILMRLATLAARLAGGNRGGACRRSGSTLPGSRPPRSGAPLSACGERPGPL